MDGSRDAVITHYRRCTLTACAVTTVVSIVYLYIATYIIGYRHGCYDSQYFEKSTLHVMLLLYKQYVEDPSCSEMERPFAGTSGTKIFMLLFLATLTTFGNILFSSILAATTLLQDVEHAVLAQRSYTAFYLASMLLDMTIAQYLIRDIFIISQILGNRSAGPANYDLDIMRVALVIVVTVALKGVSYHLFNLSLIVASHNSMKDYVLRQRELARSRQALLLSGARRQAPGADDEAAAAVAPLRHASVDDLPRHRRLQATRARRARDNVPDEIPERELMLRETPPWESSRPVPTVSGLVASRVLCCTCHVRQRRNYRPNRPLLRDHSSAYAESLEMIIACPSPCGSNERTLYTITEV